ncbi:MAG: phosphate signaling complex protein PhoU [Planctomycetota bacterium]
MALSSQLDEALSKLRHELSMQFGFVEEMIDGAIQSLSERNVDLAASVIVKDRRVNHQERLIERETEHLIALHAPRAGDLRYLTTIYKVSAATERMADLSCNIAERSMEMFNYPQFTVPSDLNTMVAHVKWMVRKASDAFLDLDKGLAQQVIRRDDLVDNLNRMLITQLQSMMREDPALIEPAVHCFSTTRHLERIADLAETLAKQIFYVVDGPIQEDESRPSDD